jgi:hypothetical protein
MRLFLKICKKIKKRRDCGEGDKERMVEEMNMTKVYYMHV